MSHLRVEKEPNKIALSELTGTQFKTLYCLINHTDQYGRCFPSQAKIASDINISERRTITEAIRVLKELCYIAVLRPSFRDEFTGEYKPNVYILNPDFINLGVSYTERARELWNHAIAQNADITEDTRVFSGTPKTTTEIDKGNKQINNQSKQQQQTASHTENAHGRTMANGSHTDDKKDQKAEKPTDKNVAQNGHATQNSAGRANTARVASAENTNGSAAAGGAGRRYTNPTPVAEPLDSLTEALAVRIQALGIPLPLARGFIATHGATTCATALSHATGGTFTQNPAGGFRYLVERKVVDPDSDKSKYENILTGNSTTMDEMSDWYPKWLENDPEKLAEWKKNNQVAT